MISRLIDLWRRVGCWCLTSDSKSFSIAAIASVTRCNSSRNNRRISWTSNAIESPCISADWGPANRRGGQSGGLSLSDGAIYSPKGVAKPMSQYPQMSQISPPEDSLRIIRTPHKIRHAYERRFRPTRKKPVSTSSTPTHPIPEEYIESALQLLARVTAPQAVSGDRHSPFCRLGICLWNLPTRREISQLLAAAPRSGRTARTWRRRTLCRKPTRALST